MPVNAYVRRDKEGTVQPPRYTSETLGAIALIQRLYERLNHERSEYTVVANLQYPSADLVTITELGIGVVELKHSAGRLDVQDSTWSTEYGRIKAGTSPNEYANPREQVQQYATRIREYVVQRCSAWWSMRESGLSKVLRVQSAVCFTNPLLTISDDVRTTIEREASAAFHRLGRFDVLKPNDFPTWVAGLRFEVAQGIDHQYMPYRLEPDQINELVAHFHAVPWSEAMGLMPAGEAYGYLILRDEGQPTQIFALHDTEISVGRSASTCPVIIPNAYQRASRVHLQLSRYGDKLWFHDLQSMHGTYVNGIHIKQGGFLHSGDVITLGGPTRSQIVCELEFFRELPYDIQATQTGTDKTR